MVSDAFSPKVPRWKIKEAAEGENGIARHAVSPRMRDQKQRKGSTIRVDMGENSENLLK